jgi:hypothetical protein
LINSAAHGRQLGHIGSSDSIATGATPCAVLYVDSNSQLDAPESRITQEQLARAAGLHVNRIRYVERQDRITTSFSSSRVEQAMLDLGVIFSYSPSPGVRLRPKEKEFG